MSDPKKIHEALADVMEDVRAVRKGDQNTHQRFMFRGVDAVVNAVGPKLRKHGVIVMPEVLEKSVDVAQTKNGAINYITKVTVKYTFTGPAGDQLSAVVPGEAMDMQDKGTAKAMSVAFRTCLLQALCLPTDDTDPDAESHEESVNPEDEIRSRIEQATVQGPDAVQSLGTWAKGRWPDWALDELRKRLATMRGK
jgi:hypothetical protein